MTKGHSEECPFNQCGVGLGRALLPGGWESIVVSSTSLKP